MEAAAARAAAVRHPPTNRAEALAAASEKGVQLVESESSMTGFKFVHPNNGTFGVQKGGSWLSCHHQTAEGAALWFALSAHGRAYREEEEAKVEAAAAQLAHKAMMKARKAAEASRRAAELAEIEAEEEAQKTARDAANDATVRRCSSTACVCPRGVPCLAALLHGSSGGSVSACSLPRHESVLSDASRRDRLLEEGLWMRGFRAGQLRRIAHFRYLRDDPCAGLFQDANFIRLPRLLELHECPYLCWVPNPGLCGSLVLCSLLSLTSPECRASLWED